MNDVWCRMVDPEIVEIHGLFYGAAPCYSREDLLNAIATTKASTDYATGITRQRLLSALTGALAFMDAQGATK